MVKPIFVRVILVGLFLTLAVQASEGQTPTINTLIGGGGATHTPAYTFAIGFDPAVVKAQFQLPDHVEIAALVALGYPGEVGLDPHRLPIESITRFV